MPDDYYEDDSDTMTKEPASNDNEESVSQSALVPKSFFAGKDNLEVGDTEKVRILRLLDDEVEIECIKEGYDKESEPEPEPVTESDEMME